LGPSLKWGGGGRGKKIFLCAVTTLLEEGSDPQMGNDEQSQTYSVEGREGGILGG